MERDLKAFPQVPRLFRLAIGITTDQDHLAGGVAAQLVFDRLHDALVAHPRGGLDPGRGQRCHGVDQVALRALPAGTQVRGPAIEEALPAGRHQDDLGRCWVGGGPRVAQQGDAGHDRR